MYDPYGSDAPSFRRAKRWDVNRPNAEHTTVGGHTLVEDVRTLLLSPANFFILLPLLTAAAACQPREPDIPLAPYHMRVAVDEVSLTLHAVDAHELPVNDLQLNELTLLDNGRPPGAILAFRSLNDVPIRASILVDASDSMLGQMARNRGIAIAYAQRVLRRQTDHASVADFVRYARTVQTWTNDPAALITAIRGLSYGAGQHENGTALLDTIYHECKYEFGSLDNSGTANFILLFTDGEDNASQVDLQMVVEACQRSNTAIYTFRAEASPGASLSGGALLARLTGETGGQVFRGDDSQEAVDEDLRIIEDGLRNQYRLIFRPANLKRDGTFHRITLLGPDRAKQIKVQSGYYAPAH